MGAGRKATHIIQLPRLEGVRRPKKVIEVVRPEVVANEGEYGNPHIGLHPMPLPEGALPF